MREGSRQPASAAFSTDPVLQHQLQLQFVASFGLESEVLALDESSGGSSWLNFVQKDREYLVACVNGGDYAA